MNYHECLKQLDSINFTIKHKSCSGHKRALYIYDDYDIRVVSKPFYFYGRTPEKFTESKKRALVESFEYMLLENPDIKNLLDFKGGCYE